jgi:hypothetical protein
MKKLLTIAFIAAFVAGCGHNVLLQPSITLHKTAHQELIEKYIPNDTSLSAADKKLRLDALKSYGELLEELNKQAK